MSSSSLLTPARRNALRVVLALVLLTGPVWAPTLHLNDPTYHYERAEVVAADGGIEYADENLTVGGDASPLSGDIACTGREYRTCGFEQYIGEQGPIPSSVYTNNPDIETNPYWRGEYRFALVNDTVYRTVSVVNHTAQNEDGLYRLDLGHDPVEPTEVLDDVALDPRIDDVPSAVASAARTGSATAPSDVEIPEIVTPEGETFYRVYQTDWVDHAPIGPYVEGALVLLGPLVGLALLGSVWLRIEVSHVGEDRRR